MAKDKPFKIDYYLDAVGRRRKLSSGAMIAICNDYADGRSVADLAGMYGVSTSMIRTVVYHTPRKSDIDRLNEARHVDMGLTMT